MHQWNSATDGILAPLQICFIYPCIYLDSCARTNQPSAPPTHLSSAAGSSSVCSTCCGCRSQMMVLMLLRISSMKGITSPTCTCTKWRRHFCAILMNVSHAMSCTPSWVSVGRKNKKHLSILYPKAMHFVDSLISRIDSAIKYCTDPTSTVWAKLQ